jgi:hypothetical protein
MIQMVGMVGRAKVYLYDTQEEHLTHREEMEKLGWRQITVSPLSGQIRAVYVKEPK